MYLRKSLLQPGDKIDVVLEWQVGMQPANDVELGDRLGVAGTSRVPDFLQRHGVGAGTIFLAAEGAQAASRDADIRVIDVAIDVEIRDVAMHALTDMVRQPANRQNVARSIERKRIIADSRSCAITLSWIGRSRASSV